MNDNALLEPPTSVPVLAAESRPAPTAPRWVRWLTPVREPSTDHDRIPPFVLLR